LRNAVLLFEFKSNSIIRPYYYCIKRQEFKNKLKIKILKIQLKNKNVKQSELSAQTWDIHFVILNKSFLVY